MKKSWKVIASILSLVLVLGCFAGCGTKEAPAPAPTEPAETEEPAKAPAEEPAEAPAEEPAEAPAEETAGKRVAFISPANQFDFFVYIGARVKQLGEERGITVDCFDAALDVAKEADLMTQAILQKYDAIIVGPCNANALEPSVEEANAAGIPVINYDSFVDADCYARVSSSNYQLGATAAEWVAEYLTERNGSASGNVIALAHPSTETMKQRVAGFVETLAAYPEIIVKEEIVPEVTAESGQEMVGNLLIANPEGTLDLVYGSNAGLILGAAAAVEAAARTDVVLVGIDNEQGELDAIQSGSNFKATVAQDAVQIGEEAMLAAIKAMDGEKSGDIVVPGILVTSDNIEEYIAADAAEKAELEPYK